MGNEKEKDIEVIYHLYFEYVYSFTLGLCNNPDMAQDITQETFYNAIKSIKNFNGKCKIQVWLCQIAKNLYYDKLKKVAKNVTLNESDLIDDRKFEDILVQKDEAYRIHKVLHVLEEPYKEVFSLRVFGELSFDIINKLFGKTGSWASVTFYRAKMKIIRNIQEVEDNEDKRM